MVQKTPVGAFIFINFHNKKYFLVCLLIQTKKVEVETKFNIISRIPTKNAIIRRERVENISLVLQEFRELFHKFYSLLPYVAIV